MELESKKKIKTIVSKKLLRKFDEKYIFGSYSKLKKLGWKPLFNTKKFLKIFVNTTKINIIIVSRKRLKA